jgi:hypothetical protein
MGILGQIWVKLGLKNEGFKQGMSESQKQVSGFRSSVKNTSAFVKVAWAAASAAVVRFGKKSIEAYNAQIAADTKLRNAIANTNGKLGLTYDALSRKAGELQKTMGYGDDEIENAMATLTTFGSVTGDVFTSAVSAAADMATFMGSDLNSAILQLGKALEVPEIGLTMLRRSGVVFTKEQIKNIKDLVAEGKKYEAQQLILLEVNKKFGGESVAQLNTMAGAWKKFSLHFGDTFFENIGKMFSWTKNLAGALDEAMSTMDWMAAHKGISYNAYVGIEEEVKFLKASGINDKTIEEEINKRIAKYESSGKTWTLEEKKDGERGLKGKAAAEYYNALISYQDDLAQRSAQIAADEKARIEALSLQQQQAAEEAIAAKEEERKVQLQQQEDSKKIIASLEQEVKQKEDLRNVATDSSTIYALNDEIALLEERLSLLRLTSAEARNARMQMGGSVTSPTPLSKKTESNTPEDIMNNAANAWKADQMEKNAGKIEGYVDMLEAQKNRAENIAASFAQAISSGFIYSIDALADAIGSGEQIDAGMMIKTLLSPLADACISAGLMIMTTGTALEALKDALINLFGGGPFAAIAAGATLMAIGAAAKIGLASIASGGSKKGSYSYSGGNSTYDAGGGSAASSAISGLSVEVTGTLKGKDIYLAGKNYENNRNR